MVFKFVIPSIWLSVIVLSTGCSVPLPEATANAPAISSVDETEQSKQLTPDQVLVLGDISSNPTRKIEQYQPLAAYLQRHLTDVGIERTVVKIAPDLETMQTWVDSGEVDLYFDSPYPVMVISNNTGAEPILRRWKEGIGEYHSIIFALKNRDIQSVTDLRNAQIALETDFSTSGYMLPFAYLQNAGFNLVKQPSEATVLQSNDIGFLFSSGEDNTIELVLSGKVDAGAVDSGTFSALPESVRSSLTIVLETESVARHIVLASTEMPVDQTEATRNLLLQMHESVDGQTVLESFENTAKFDEFPVDASIERLEELYNQTL